MGALRPVGMIHPTAISGMATGEQIEGLLAPLTKAMIDAVHST